MQKIPRRPSNKQLNNRKPRDVSLKPKIYVSIDVETVDEYVMSIGAVIASYPNGQILEIFDAFCVPPNIQNMSNNTNIFWMVKNIDAFNYNVQRGTGATIHDVERSMCEFFQHVSDSYDDYIVISDCISFDTYFINGILLRNGFNRLSARKNNKHAQEVCSWSYRLALQSIYGYIKQSPVGSRQVEQVYHDGLRHTPLVDACKVLSLHFRLLDFVNLQNEQQKIKRKNFHHNNNSQ